MGPKRICGDEDWPVSLPPQEEIPKCDSKLHEVGKQRKLFAKPPLSPPRTLI